MKILITGAHGFVGQNLRAALGEIRAGHDRREDHVLCGDPAEITVKLIGRENSPEELEAFCKDCDFVFHLAGVNRPQDPAEFMRGNRDLTGRLLEALRRHNNRCPILLSSSIQASLEGRFQGSPYGESKRAGEELLFQYARETGAQALVYRLPNVFGKWCRPNYNSAVATFCHNTANDLPIQINDPAVPMELVYIDDVVEEFLQALRGCGHRAEDGTYRVPVVHRASLGWIAETILSFPKLRESLEVPKLDDPLTKKLYSTYLSYLPAERFACDLKMNEDPRGSFTELIRTPDRGQFSVNISRPGVTKGQHWHHTKNEKFIVVKGEALIQLRRVGAQADGTPYPVEEFRVSGRRIQAVEMIPGYTHNIINLSQTEELVTLMWANEPFDPARPDTFFEEV
ncbi:capsular polysaccharide biosynthesis protein CapF [Oscillibacter sp.]|jgi:UDP-2-acetamido-2,6-beta-L-arabino-hexul-4-ose reductase|uniref:capsular polysaccharide biosynthesis protein CapF n=1 Tax=Oscillibacter sp. TaxID=1945593 RepID=UPI00216FD84C|nr:capsular polysaccharide biosynthesis protein CapF [Oscillibacter sp.]MCI9648373.1 capsular polysaccharide biosynthesis protein CapF [Oscillibacter sp.]